MHKIVVNTMPRSGSTFFLDALRDMYYHNDHDYLDPRESGHWTQKDSWIIGAHDPLLFYANFNGIYQTISLRNPVDNIASSIHKTSFGFGKSTVIGRPDIVEDHIKRIVEDKKAWLDEAMYQESMMWEGYAINSARNIEKIIPFTFEQVTQNLPAVLKTIHHIVDKKESVRFRTQQEIDQMISHMKKVSMQDIQYSSGAANALPVAKPESYYEIVDAVSKFRLINRLMDVYQETLEVFKNKQKDYSFI
jgi:hypothetical protein